MPLLVFDRILESPNRLAGFNFDREDTIRIIALNPTLESDRVGHCEENEKLRVVHKKRVMPVHVPSIRVIP
jgi:hypothetical protein